MFIPRPCSIYSSSNFPTEGGPSHLHTREHSAFHVDGGRTRRTTLSSKSPRLLAIRKAWLQFSNPLCNDTRSVHCPDELQCHQVGTEVVSMTLATGSQNCKIGSPSQIPILDGLEPQWVRHKPLEAYVEHRTDLTILNLRPEEASR